MKSVAQPEAEQNAVVKLFPYQREAVTDNARFCLHVWARQTGKDFSLSLKHLRRRLRLGGDSICIAAGQRQTVQTIEKVKMHCRAMEQKFEYEEIEFPGVDEFATQVTLKHNGARFLAMPANPDTVRGFTGDVWLNELAFMKFAREMWKAAFAIATRGFNVDASSTPHGQSGQFWDVCKAAGVSPLGAMDKTHWAAGRWSVHWADIYTAIAQGYPVDYGEIRDAINDEDTCLQEYELHFLADAENYIPLELVIACESEQATLEESAAPVMAGVDYLGVDIGRKKDRTVIWKKRKVGDVLWTRAVTVLERTPFAAQFSIIDSMMRGVSRCCVDATGLGAQIAEDLARKWGASRVEQVVFNIENKEKMATAQKASFEERRERIPAAAFIRRSINAVKRYTSQTGHFRFDADRTEAGHADEFWASALCTAAASGPGVSVEILTSGIKSPGALVRDGGYGMPARSAYAEARGW
jgi:phage FluMu gp28-like protein